MLQESASAAPHQSVRDSIWVEFMLGTGISDEELELAKRVYAYSLEHLEIGSGVEVRGLQARLDLNAKHARIVAYVPERERYHVVILGTDEEVYLRRANLTRPAAAAAPATAFSYSLLSRGRSQPTSSESQPTSSESERRIGLAPISPDARNPRSKNFQDFKRKGCCVVLRKSTESLVHLSCSAFQYIVSFFPSTDHSL